MRRGGEACPVFVDEIEVRPFRVALRDQEVPRPRDQQEDHDSFRQVQGAEAVPLVEDKKPYEYDGARNEETDRSLRQSRQRGCGVEPAEKPAALGSRWGAQAENETEQRC